jgi:hypothetical protein
MTSPQYDIAGGFGTIDYRLKGTVVKGAGVDFLFIHDINYQNNSAPVHWASACRENGRCARP